MSLLFAYVVSYLRAKHATDEVYKTKECEMSVIGIREVRTIPFYEVY